MLLALWSGIGALQAQYCVSNIYTTGCTEQAYIDGLNLAGFTQTGTGCTGGLGLADYTGTTINVNAGTPYNYTVTSGNGTLYANKMVLWYVDLNSDGDFTDANEYRGNSPFGNTALTGTVTIPGSGLRRLRVRLLWWPESEPLVNLSLYSCSSWPIGETHDYTLNINPSPNNECAQAIELTSALNCTDTQGTLLGATSSIGPITCNTFTAPAALDVWYKFTATHTAHTVRARGSSTVDAIIDIRTNACNGTNIACADVTGLGGQESVTFATAIGLVYYVRLYHYGSSIPATPTFAICVTSYDSAPCDNSTSVTCGTSITTTLPTGNGALGDLYDCTSFATLLTGGEKVSSITVVNTGTHPISATNNTGERANLYTKVGSCGPSGWTCLLDLAAGANGSLNLNLTAGNVVYFLWKKEGPTSSGTANWTIGCPALGNVNVSGCTGAGNVIGAPTLGAAIAGIALAQPGANIVVDILSNTTESTSSITIGAGTWNSLTIRPQGGAPRTVTGATTTGTPLIDLNSATNVTIDGLNMGGNSLTLVNTTASGTAGTATIRFVNDARTNTVTRCTVLSSCSASLNIAAGTVLFSTGVVNGNDNNVVSLCDIGPASTTHAKGIHSTGSFSSAAIRNSGNQILNNTIRDCFFAATTTTGIHIFDGNDAWTISGNRIYQTATRTFTGANLRTSGITLNMAQANLPGSMMVINNIIGFGNDSGTGTTVITGSSNEFRGIDARSVSISTPTSIQGNIISGISQTTSRNSITFTSSAFIGIMLGSTDGLFDCGSSTGNIIGSLDGSSTITVSSSSVTASTAPVFGIYDFSLQPSLISKNSIGSITIQGVGTTVGFRGIRVHTVVGVNAVLSNNTIANITDTQVGSYAMHGIDVLLPNLQATNNTIRDIIANSNGAGLLVVSGILLSSGSAGVCTISGNTVHSLVNNAGTASNSVFGIDLNFATASNLVERNVVHSLNVTGSNTGCQLNGIVRRGAGTATVRNNMVRLGLKPDGTSITTGFFIAGLQDIAGGTNNYYHNSVYIGGSNVVSDRGTYAFISDVVTVTREFRDNIFWNARSNTSSSSVSNYAIRVGGTAVNPPGLTCNHNDLLANGTGGAVGVFNGFYYSTIADWRTVSGMDLLSQNADPNFINPEGTAATVDLHISPTLATVVEATGSLVASVTQDFDSQTRSGLTPVDIGADAGNFVSTICTGPGGTISGPTTAGTHINYNYTASGFTGSPTFNWQYALSSTGPWTSYGVNFNPISINYTGAGTYYVRCVLTLASCPSTSNVIAVVATVSNDNVCDAITLNVGANGPFTNSGATLQPGESSPPVTVGTCTFSSNSWCSAPNNSIWFKFVAPSTGHVQVRADGWASQLAVWSAPNCADLLNGQATLLGAFDNGVGGLTNALVDVCVNPGQVYYVQADGDGSTINSNFSVSLLVQNAMVASISATPLTVTPGGSSTVLINYPATGAVVYYNVNGVPTSFAGFGGGFSINTGALYANTTYEVTQISSGFCIVPVTGVSVTLTVLGPPDCAGVAGGSAFLDNCNVCVGGTTGLTACVQDCNNVFGGTAFLDNCNVCVGGNTGLTACVQDCNGVYGGSALPGTSCNDNNTCTINDVLTAGCVCAGTFQDSDGDGICNANDNCPNIAGQIGSPCTVADAPGLISAGCVCTPLSACTENVTVELRTDALSSQASWQILSQNTNNVLCQFSVPVNGITSPITQDCCLPAGCYRLRVSDSGGDGFVNGGMTGGYQLRESGISGRRIIDNLGNFTNLAGGPTDVSAIASSLDNGAFCVPIGEVKPRFDQCDKLDWTNYNFMVCSRDNDVFNAYAPGATTTGYEFWFYDPNGSYSFRRFRSHATSDGINPPVMADRACHFQINRYVPPAPGDQELNKEVPYNTLLNVRIRARVNGVNKPFGLACFFKMDATRAACPLVKLQDNPADANFSCNVPKVFGGVNSSANKLTAVAPQFSPNTPAPNVRYQFRFRVPGEIAQPFGCILRPIQTSPTLYLNWTTGVKLRCNTQYEVDVRVSRDGGATWCVGGATNNPADCNVSVTPWGRICNVNITTSPNCGGLTGGGANSLAPETAGDLTMYPNPNRGDQLFLSLSEVPADVHTVSVDIYDMTGKKVTTRAIPVQNGYLNTALDLNPGSGPGQALSGGLYIVNITAGDKIYAERLVIQP